jgi:hypothetical protein
MKAKQVTTVQTERTEIPVSFDLVRLSRSKEICDFAPNTIRKFFNEGLRAYRVGKMVMFSKSELAALIKARATG